MNKGRINKLNNILGFIKQNHKINFIKCFITRFSVYINLCELFKIILTDIYVLELVLNPYKL